MVRAVHRIARGITPRVLQAVRVSGIPNKGANFLLLVVVSELGPYPSPSQFDSISECYFAPYALGHH
jgi:hypothetical protein